MFNHIYKASFKNRPNRFVIHCQLPGKGTVRAFLPNPGRLRELLLPDATVYLAANGAADRSPGRKTAYTAVAVERDGQPVFLHTHLNNEVARGLIDSGRIPGLEDAVVEAAEVTVGRSRFDFLLRQDGTQRLAEVKSVTLFGNGVAMFPDAVTDRGRRHIEELAAMRGQDKKPVVLFLIHYPGARWFMPDYHTDLAFSQTLLRVRKRIEVLPVALRWGEKLSCPEEARPVSIPWAHIEREARDRGHYIALARLNRRARLEWADRQTVTLNAGWYLWTGSADEDLSAAVRREYAKRKRPNSYTAALRNRAAGFHVLPIRCSKSMKRAIHEELTALYGGVKDAPAPCWATPDDPLDDAGFHRALERMRMRPPDDRPASLREND